RRGDNPETWSRRRREVRRPATAVSQNRPAVKAVRSMPMSASPLQALLPMLTSRSLGVSPDPAVAFEEAIGFGGPPGCGLVERDGPGVVGPVTDDGVDDAPALGDLV